MKASSVTERANTEGLFLASAGGNRETKKMRSAFALKAFPPRRKNLTHIPTRLRSVKSRADVVTLRVFILAVPFIH